MHKGHCTVLRHHGVHGPGRAGCAGHKGFAPANGPPGDGNHDQSRSLQVGQRLQRVRSDGAVGGQGVVNVGEHAHQVAAGGFGPVGQGLHAAVRYAAAFARKGAIVRELVMQRWVVMGLSLWLLAGGAAAQTRGDQAFTCQRAASKMDGLIDDWHAMVLEYQAEAKNPSVLADVGRAPQGAAQSQLPETLQSPVGHPPGHLCVL